MTMEIVIPALATLLIPVDVALVAIVKQYFDPKYSALFSLFFGILLACLIPNLGGWRELLLDGIVIGLSASGLYSGTKAVLE